MKPFGRKTKDNKELILAYETFAQNSSGVFGGSSLNLSPNQFWKREGTQKRGTKWDVASEITWKSIWKGEDPEKSIGPILTYQRKKNLEESKVDFWECIQY